MSPGQVSAATVCADLQPDGVIPGEGRPSEGDEAVAMQAEGDPEGTDAPTLDVCGGSWGEADTAGGPSGHGGAKSGTSGLGEESKPQSLFNGAALQLWLLACCQVRNCTGSNPQGSSGRICLICSSCVHDGSARHTRKEMQQARDAGHEQA